ncbi:MAG TPA: hydroxymethylpyrimidine/phosphomethylpyrimidine kinase [Gammaproteobacteria bacterium]
MNSESSPAVLIMAGNDPTGGAGITADIESVISQGCFALPVITCVTVQDTCDVLSINPLEAELIVEQARTVLEDLSVKVIKIGLLGSEENVEAVHELLADYPDIKIVLDPILSAGGGHPLASEGIIDAIKELLLPYTTVLTPNTMEALQLIPGADSIQAAALALQELGCEYVLVTGTHENSPTVVNRLFGQQQELKKYNWERLPHSYHGSGCTLASALAGLLAQDLNIFEAVEQAQQYTWQSLKHGGRLGMGQYHPNRLFWADDETADENQTPS